MRQRVLEHGAPHTFAFSRSCSHVAAVSDVAATAGLIAAQEIRAENAVRILCDKYFVSRTKPIGERVVATDVASDRDRLSRLKDRLQEAPDVLAILGGGGTDADHVHFSEPPHAVSSGRKDLSSEMPSGPSSRRLTCVFKEPDMTTKTLFKETLAALLLAGAIFAPAVVAFAQTAPPPNPLMALPEAIKATPGCLGVETAMTSSGKMVIFAWFENKKAALAWYYSQTHQALVKMGGGSSRPGGPMTDVPDDGKPIMAIASVTLSRAQDGIPPSGLPPVSQIAVELYSPLPGGLAAGGRFAPMSVNVPGLLYTPDTALPNAK